MKLLLLGATGRTGKRVLEEALSRGYEIHCLSRNADRIKPQSGLTVFEGDPSNASDLEKVISGCDAVINALNISRTSDFPWAKLRTPETYLSDVMSALIPLAEANATKRIIICSAWGTAETKKDLPKWFKWIIDNSNVGAAYRDHERQEAILSASGMDWTVVRPVGLTNSKKPQGIKETFENDPRPGLTVSRQAVAQFLVDCLQRADLIQTKVTISKQ